MERRELKTKSFRKVLTTSATCIVLATSFAGGTLRVWAEQLYYGWNDGTRQYSPFFLYATPTTESQRKLETIVYCFNRNNHWPDNWESSRTSPTSLPLYNKEVGTNELFKKTATTPKKSDKLIESLIVVLSKGYPNVKHIENLREDQSRKITQLAIWYFSDSFSKEHFRTTYGLTSEEDQALQNLIKAGENPDLSEAQKKQTLDLYIYKSGGTGYSGGYQNLLGSTLIPRIDGFGGQNHHKLDGLKGELPGLSGEAGAPEKPGTFGKNDKPLNGLEGGKTDLPDGEKGEAGPPATPQKPNDPLQGLEGGNSPIVEQNYGSTEGYHGQSGILEETEDTNPPGIILGGSGNVETHEDTRDPHLMGLGGGLAGESGETTPKPGQTGGHGPIIETTEDTQKGMSGQSGGTIESENTKKPEVMIGGQGQTIETTEDTQKGMSGQSGGTIESEDTKKPEVMIGGQGQIIDFSENTQSGMSGQSGDTTVIEDTKKSEIITGGQGQIIDFSEDTQPGMSGQSGGTTIVEDTQKPTPKPKPAPAPIVNDEKPNKGTQLPQTSDMKQLTLSIIGAMSMLLVLCLSLFKRPSKKD
ncbi:TPA: fibronectin binding protein [Streptococcus equi subsp. zooepidemicus]|nr:fibronectin binding protein [Streptococcus equi subsp. zooepidemicus]HEL0121417.1 fibronectin binding protein [Streptococcus equi subsp. zooepidemicus]HEL0125663.1 fibronectin binding protein [Streptococcus equi subsp. zooepidemicus]HEL0135445.1 fibronectin binding protein [Streptococcus equi subsp. zooepidemicus]HEL0141409.1 fibronectin binding protein [Streptococcus equi subsp. zooepidemicus]